MGRETRLVTGVSEATADGQKKNKTNPKPQPPLLVSTSQMLRPRLESHRRTAPGRSPRRWDAAATLWGVGLRVQGMGFRGFRSFGVSKVHKLGFSEAKYPTRTSHIFSGRFRFWDAGSLLKGLGVQGFQGMFLGFNWCVRYFHAGLLQG